MTTPPVESPGALPRPTVAIPAGRAAGVLGRGLVDPADPVLAAEDLGLGRGDGCFETLRVLAGEDPGEQRRVQGWDAHLDRLERSCAALELPRPDRAAWAALAAELVASAGSGESALKLMVTRGLPGSGVPTGVATLAPLPASALRQREAGIAVVSLSRGTPADAHADAPWLLGGVKTLSYAVHTAAVREAERRGADDALLVSTDGFALEGPTSSLLWWADGALRTTPAGPTGILTGTTQEALFAAAADEGVRVEAALVPVVDLTAADAAWFASSVRGIVEVISLDGVPLPRLPELTARWRRLAGF
ncbi:aminotransferase class IV [Kineococcus xinjiangensis]|uniref:aminotransferase class IV n=1 Tax=Kineococcus xinjiangensis TaxID=512762 RepID=UPI001B80006C|nr:aminotransferase class IV [Kineococcus xinjiangensis]